jgi:hypothetical protein
VVTSVCFFMSPPSLFTQGHLNSQKNVTEFSAEDNTTFG